MFTFSRLRVYQDKDINKVLTIKRRKSYGIYHWLRDLHHSV